MADNLLLIVNQIYALQLDPNYVKYYVGFTMLLQNSFRDFGDLKNW